MKHFRRMLAYDFGAASGRAIGAYDGKILSINEIHRFRNAPVYTVGHLYWNSLNLFKELQ